MDRRLAAWAADGGAIAPNEWKRGRTLARLQSIPHTISEIETRSSESTAARSFEVGQKSALACGIRLGSAGAGVRRSGGISVGGAQ